MASSPIPEIGPLRAPQGVHLLLAVGVPATFWNLVVFWVTGSAPSWPLAPLALLYATVMAFWAPWSQRTHQGPLLRFWLWLVVTLLLYTTFGLIEGLPWPATFGPTGLHILWFAVAFLQGQISALWATQLASRARLYQLIEGMPSGRSLEQRVRDFQLDADFSRANETALSGSLAALCVLVVALATFSPYGKNGLSMLLAGGYVGLSLVLGVLFRLYRREMEAFMYGRRLSLAEKTEPLLWSMGLIVLAAAGAAGLMALGGPWVDWSSLLQGRFEPVPLPQGETTVTRPKLEIVNPNDYRLAVLLALLEEIFRFKNILVVFGVVIRALVWLAPWAIVAFLVWPLVRWILSGGRETKGLGRRWWQLLVAQWKSFWANLGQWWLRPFAAETDVTVVSNPREWLQSLFRRPKAGQRVPYPEIIEAFLRLVQWAEPLTSYRQGETTREYLDRLTSLVPTSSDDLEHLRDLLDRELFGPQGLDAQGRGAFLALVTRLTASPPSHDSPPGVS